VTGLTVNQAGSLLCVYNIDGPVQNYGDACKADTARFSENFRKLLKAGIYTAPSQFEAMFLSDAFTAEDIDYTIETYEQIAKGDN
jgi:Glutamate-1-semialdehyde aminotransferase